MKLTRPHKHEKGQLEWMWQYGPPPAGGREHDLIQDPAFRPVPARLLHGAPQSFWGPNNGDPKDPNHKPLPEVVDEFLRVPGVVIADDNRYITATGCVFHFCPSRGMIFADLDGKNPFVAFAAINWTKEGHTPNEPDAEYTLWIFPDMKTGTPQDPNYLPPAFVHSLVRWRQTPIPGLGYVQKIRNTILVDPDGTPHPIETPKEGAR